MSTRVLAAIFLLAAAGAVYAAKVVPAYEAEKLPGPEEEAGLWETASRHENRIRNGGRALDNRAVETYLESLAQRLVGSRLDHLGISIDFMIVAEPTLSGWVYPYGTIGVHTGLMVRMDNEAQLAAILAHEISHFLQRHTYREMLDGDRQSALGKGLGFLATLAVARETGTFDSNIMDATGNFWLNLSTSGYSKKNEYVADEEGLVLMHQAGFELNEALPAFTALGENKAYGAGDPRKMWSSHPRLEDRIRNLEKEIRRMKRKRDFVAGTVPEQIDYDRKIAPLLLVNARLDLQEQQFGRAREALARYLAVAPDDAEAHFLMGEAYRGDKPLGPDFSDALSAYEAAVAENAGFAPAHREIGMAHRIGGDSARARAAFAAYLENAPEAADAGIVRAYMESLP